jgi:hypothetical protein
VSYSRLAQCYSPCTPTRTPTSPIPLAYAHVHPYPDNAADLRRLVTGGHQRTCCLYLGVKSSQVQILSARPRLEQVRGGFGEIRGRLDCVLRVQYANAYANPARYISPSAALSRTARLRLPTATT